MCSRLEKWCSKKTHAWPAPYRGHLNIFHVDYDLLRDVLPDQYP
jgi:hypothetical protein